MRKLFFRSKFSPEGTPGPRDEKSYLTLPGSGKTVSKITKNRLLSFFWTRGAQRHGQEGLGRRAWRAPLAMRDLVTKATSAFQVADDTPAQAASCKSWRARGPTQPQATIPMLASLARGGVGQPRLGACEPRSQTGRGPHGRHGHQDLGLGQGGSRSETTNVACIMAHLAPILARLKWYRAPCTQGA